MSDYEEDKHLGYKYSQNPFRKMISFLMNIFYSYVFEDMIKTLTEFPNIYAKDIENIVRAEEQPREILVEFLTTKITESIKLGLNNAKTAAKKYFKELNVETIRQSESSCKYY